MGMYDNVKCEYPLPDTPPEIQKDVFQTKAFGDGFVGGFLDSYTITKEGKLILHKSMWESVPEEERPFYGTPQWDDPIGQLCGSLKRVPISDDEVNYHGVIRIYTITDDMTWYEYEIKFTDGKVSDVKRIYKELG